MSKGVTAAIEAVSARLRLSSRGQRKAIVRATRAKAQNLAAGWKWRPGETATASVGWKWGGGTGVIEVHWCFGNRMFASVIGRDGAWWSEPNAVADAVESVGWDFEHVRAVAEGRGALAETTDFGEEARAYGGGEATQA